MINFAYTRASDIAEAVRAATADPNAKFIAGGTNLIDLMKEDVERPTRLIDITHLPLKAVEETADGGLRIGALVTNTDLAYHPMVESRYPLLVERDPRRRLAAAAQHGDDRRQPAAADALLLLLRHRDAVQQARAGQRLLGDRRRQPHARDPRRERSLHRHAPVRHVRRARGARRDRACARARRASARSRSPTSTACPATRRSATPSCSRPRSSRRSICRPKGSRRTTRYLKLRDRLSYAFALVSVAAALKLDGGTIARSAARARRRRAQAVARPVGRDDAARTSRRARRASRRPPTCCCATRKGYAHNAFKIELARKAHRARADPGGERHAAVAVRQEGAVTP